MFVLLVAAVCNDASGTLIVSLDVDTNEAGIQRTRSVSLGNAFDVDVVFELTEGTTLSSYEISIEFDALKFDFDGLNSSESNTRGFLSNPGFATTVDSDTGRSTVSDVDGISIAGTSDPGPFTVARLRFVAESAGPGSSSPFDLLPGFFDGDDEASDASIPVGMPLSPEFLGSSISINAAAVPEPSSLALVGVAFSALVLRPRRRNNQ